MTARDDYPNAGAWDDDHELDAMYAEIDALRTALKASGYTDADLERMADQRAQPATHQDDTPTHDGQLTTTVTHDGHTLTTYVDRIDYTLDPAYTRPGRRAIRQTTTHYLDGTQINNDEAQAFTDQARQTS